MKIYYARTLVPSGIVWLFEETVCPMKLEQFKMGDAKMRTPHTSRSSQGVCGIEDGLKVTIFESGVQLRHTYGQSTAMAG